MNPSKHSTGVVVTLRVGVVVVIGSSQATTVRETRSDASRGIPISSVIFTSLTPPTGNSSGVERTSSTPVGMGPT